MNTKQLLQEAVALTADAYEEYIKSNIRRNQLCWGMNLLKEKVNNLGDIGMAYAYSLLESKHEDEKDINESLYAKYLYYEDLTYHLLNVAQDKDLNNEWFHDVLDQRCHDVNEQKKENEKETKKRIA